MYVFSFSYAGKGVQRKAVPSCLRKAAKLCETFFRQTGAGVRG